MNSLSMVIKDIKKGVGVFFLGLSLLGKYKNLRKYLIIPFFIYVILLILGIYESSILIDKAMVYVNNFFIDWTFFKNFVLGFSKFIIWVLVVTLLIYSLFAISSIIASPFYSFMTEKCLIQLGTIKEENSPFKNVVKTSLLMLWISLKKTLFFVILGIFFFVLSLFPGLNLIATLGVFLVLCFDCLDYSFEILSWDLQSRFRFFFQNFWIFLGMTISFNLFLYVPLLNLLVFPIMIVGGSRLIHELLQKKISS